MDRKAALATAAGLVLVVAGAASALAAGWASPTEGSVAETTAKVVTEYVDEAGNPVAPPGAVVEGETVIMTVSPAAEEIVVYEEADVVYVDAPGFSGSGSTTTIGGFDDSRDDDHDEDEGEHEEDEHEDEDEHGDEDESDDD